MLNYGMNGIWLNRKDKTNESVLASKKDIPTDA